MSVVAGSGAPAISTNSGTIINNAGGSIIGDFNVIVAVGNTSIFNAGTITANNGPAIVFSSGGNTLTLGPGSVINGNVVASGTDRFQLGGTGAGTFDAGPLGVQYTGFSTFKKADASTWTLTGTQTVTTPWTVSSGTLIVNGSIANSSLTTVDNGGNSGRHRHCRRYAGQRRRHALAGQRGKPDRHVDGRRQSHPAKRRALSRAQARLMF